MKFETKIDTNHQIRIHALSGQFIITNLLDELVKFYDGPDYDPDMHVILDLRNVEGMGSLATADLNKLVSLDSRRWASRQPRRAALVVARMVDFGLARMYEMRMESVSKNEIRVFTDIGQAREWLGITKETH